MPWKSKKQQRWGHGKGGKKAGFSTEKIEEWDDKTNFESLPEEALIDEAATKDDVKSLKKLSREHNMGMRSGGFHSPPKGKKQYTRKEKHKEQSKSESLTPTDETYRRYSFPIAKLVAGLNWSTWEQETHSEEGYVPAWGFHSVVDRGVDPHEKHDGARKIEQAPSPLPASGSGTKLHKAYALNWATEGRPCGDEEKYPEKCGPGEGPEDTEPDYPDVSTPEKKRAWDESVDRYVGGPEQGEPSSPEEEATQRYQFGMLSSHLTQYDQRLAKRESHPNIYRIGHFLKAAQDMEKAVKSGQDMESAFADSFTPSGPMETIAKKLGLGMAVQRGEWVKADPPNPDAHPRDRWKKPRQKAAPEGGAQRSDLDIEKNQMMMDPNLHPQEREDYLKNYEQEKSRLGGQVWSSTLNWEVLAYGHGGYHYNPHVSKPVALEPIGEEGGYHYFGPPPDGGFSYGLYTDGTNTIAAQRAAQVYSPITGAPMKYAGDASYDLVKQALSGSKFPNLLHSCGACAYAYVTSADYLKNLNCPACGSTSEYGNAMMRGRRAAKK